MGCECIYNEPRDLTLVSGNTCCKRCELWRMECEARHILNEPGKAARQLRLANIERRRGAEHVKKLKRVIMEVWNETRS